LNDFFNSKSNLLFTKFETTYKRKTFYEQELGYIKPEEVLLKTACSYDENNKLIEKSSFGYYIPFETSLAKHLENIPKNIDLNKFNQLEQTDNLLKSDFFDGQYVKKVISTSRRHYMTNFLSFLIYNDDVELTNAIGASRTKHKLSKN
jgi:hypothetical protein